MSEWVLLRSESDLETKARALRRKCRGHYYTNYYFFNSTRDDDLQYTEMFYQEDGDNIYAIERRDEYYQLFYFVGDVDRLRLELPSSVERGVMTCEIDEEEGKEKQGPVLEKLYTLGFSDYANFHAYTRERGQDFRRFHAQGLDFNYQASVKELSGMYDIFDPYMYGLPLKKTFPQFLKTMDILSCAIGGKYAGTTMTKKNGWGEGYIFVRDEFPGVGAYLLSERLDRELRTHPNKIAQVMIADHNTRSIRLHEGFGYQRTKQYHKVLIRRK